MSQYVSQSPKYCGKQSFYKLQHLPKKLILAISSFFTLILLFIFLIWIILHPSKPQFTLKEAVIYQLNLSGPHLLNSSIQFTMQAKNPNTKVGIYYDTLQAYAAYKGQQITVDSSLPPFYQGHDDSTTLSASLVGKELPVSPSFGFELKRDQTSGKLVLNIKVDGKIKWKVGTWVSGRYRLNVNCIAVMDFGPYEPTGSLSSSQGSHCSASV